MAKEDKRFQTLHEQKNSISEGIRVLQDRETGVLYLCTWVGASGGLTPLLGADGTPQVAPVE